MDWRDEGCVTSVKSQVNQEDLAVHCTRLKMEIHINTDHVTVIQVNRYLKQGDRPRNHNVSVPDD